MATPFSVEDIGSMCPPCPPAFTDDGRFIWVAVLWVFALTAIWPFARLRQRAPLQKEFWKPAEVIVFTSSAISLFAVALTFQADQSNTLSQSFGSFLSFITQAQPVQACLGCADLEPVVYRIMAMTIVPLYLISLIALMTLRRRLSVVAAETEPHIKAPLWWLLGPQILLLIPYGLLALLQISAG